MDNRATFHNLKLDTSLNALSDEDIQQLWLPLVIFIVCHHNHEDDDHDRGDDDDRDRGDDDDDHHHADDNHADH